MQRAWWEEVLLTEMKKLTKKKLQLLKVTQGCIMLVFNCFGLTGLNNIRDMTDSGELKLIVIAIFSLVSPLFAKLSDSAKQEIELILLNGEESKKEMSKVGTVDVFEGSEVNGLCVQYITIDA